MGARAWASPWARRRALAARSGRGVGTFIERGGGLAWLRGGSKRWRLKIGGEKWVSAFSVQNLREPSLSARRTRPVHTKFETNQTDIFLRSASAMSHKYLGNPFFTLDRTLSPNLLPLLPKQTKPNLPPRSVHAPGTVSVPIALFSFSLSFLLLLLLFFFSLLLPFSFSFSLLSIFSLMWGHLHSEPEGGKKEGRE